MEIMDRLSVEGTTFLFINKTGHLFEFRPLKSVNPSDVFLQVRDGGHGAGDEGLLQGSSRTLKTLELEGSLLI